VVRLTPVFAVDINAGRPGASASRQYDGLGALDNDCAVERTHHSLEIYRVERREEVPQWRPLLQPGLR
jgi:hypothetical protein